MKIRTKIIDPVSDEQWDRRLGDHSKLNFFHSRAWAQALFETYKYRPIYVCTLKDDFIVNLLPLMEVKSFLTGKRGVSLPFTDYCEPILSNGLSLTELLKEVRVLGQEQGWNSIQIRGGAITDSPPQEQFYVHELNIEADPETLFKKFRSSKQRNIRKAGKQKMKIIHANDLDSVDAYYRLHCQTRKRHGVPPQPYRFFRNIYKYVIEAGKGKVILAEHENQMIAGCIFFHFNKKALYKFGASNQDYQHLRPNDLVMWEAIRWHASNGYQRFCFGRTALDNTGLRRFKLDWSTEERIVNYYRYDLKQGEYVTSDEVVKSSHERIFQKLPIVALKLCGSVLYKHMG